MTRIAKHRQVATSRRTPCMAMVLKPVVIGPTTVKRPARRKQLSMQEQKRVQMSDIDIEALTYYPASSEEPQSPSKTPTQSPETGVQCHSKNDSRNLSSYDDIDLLVLAASQLDDDGDDDADVENDTRKGASIKLKKSC